ncbi:hypothetical protein, partial [Kingella denitrificans]|uniref:hypothetical protein n=1 Tax=Kingella denitrificans TaxID=502 RepID=UPI001C9B6F0E
MTPKLFIKSGTPWLTPDWPEEPKRSDLFDIVTELRFQEYDRLKAAAIANALPVSNPELINLDQSTGIVIDGRT